MLNEALRPGEDEEVLAAVDGLAGGGGDALTGNSFRSWVGAGGVRVGRGGEEDGGVVVAIGGVDWLRGG